MKLLMLSRLNSRATAQCVVPSDVVDLCGALLVVFKHSYASSLLTCSLPCLQNLFGSVIDW